ncbi:MAG: DUF2269 family protein [Acidimicrobiia bacterium]|nr:DUF2269 family protein [Acidimicrobiia bacterium]MDX2467083.1 DUF2269 family protein [Acidimicrobiia bacterium]
MGALLLTIHIIAVATWLGASVTQALVTPAMQKTGGASAAAWMRQTTRMSVVLYMPAAIVLLITGVWMVVRESLYDFEQTFVAIGFLAIVAGTVLGIKIFGPGGEKTAELHEAGDKTGADESHRRLAMYGVFDIVLVGFTIWAMVERLGL